MEQRVIKHVFDSAALVLFSADCDQVLLKYKKRSGWRELPTASAADTDVSRCKGMLTQRTERIGVVDEVSCWHLPEATQQWQHKSESGLATNTRLFFFGCLPMNPNLTICTLNGWKMVSVSEILRDAMKERGIAVRGEGGTEWVGGSRRAINPYHVLGVLQALQTIRTLLSVKDNEARSFDWMLAELARRGVTLDAYMQRIQRLLNG